jgi:hypothetical protein
MENTKNDDLESKFNLYNPTALQGRLAFQESPEAFIEKLEWTQSIPCPWGDFKGKTPAELKKTFGFFNPNRQKGFPLALELGCGEGFQGTKVTMGTMGTFETTCPPFYLSGLGEARIKLYSDYISTQSPYGVPKNYIQIDLTRPDQIDLGGLRCHLIVANMVFLQQNSPDLRYGVHWPSDEVAENSIKAIFNLLLPNGLLYISPRPNLPRAVNINHLLATCGLHRVDYREIPYDLLLQKNPD